MKSYESEFSSLPGDPSKAYTTYGPEQSESVVGQYLLYNRLRIDTIIEGQP